LPILGGLNDIIPKRHSQLCCMIKQQYINQIRFSTTFLVDVLLLSNALHTNKDLDTPDAVMATCEIAIERNQTK